MPTEEVVDLDLAPAQGQRKGLWLRIGAPIGGVLLVFASILAIIFYTDRVNRVGVLGLSNSLLAGLQAHIAQQVSGYLDPATRAALLARDMVARNAVPDNRAVLEPYAASVLKHMPQIDAFYVADRQGDFMMVRRGDDGGTATKLINNAPGARAVMWVYRDKNGNVVRTEPTPADDYDPRTRGWYKGALATKGVFWTGVYVFFTARAPGVTASILTPDKAGTVFGIDITLKALSDFLATLHIGKTGRAVIIDGAGRLIAAPDGSRVLRGEGKDLTTVRIDELSDRALARAYDLSRIEGYGSRLISIDDEPLVAVMDHLPAASHDWSLLMVVPEQDFTGFVAANSRRALALSLVVVGLTALLAGLLVRQGLRADRAARRLLDRGHAAERQGAAFATLARQPGLMDPADEAPLHTLTETLAELAAARRTSVWRVTDGGRTLACDDAFERETAGHISGLEIARAELRQFFAALAQEEPVESNNAASDRRTAELHRVLMQPFNSRALAAVAIRAGERLRGAILLEDAGRLAEVRDLLPPLAGLLAVRMREPDAQVAPGETPGEAPRATPAVTATVPAIGAVAAPALSPTGTRDFAADLALRGIDTATIGADVFPAVAVMVVLFGDPVAIAAQHDAESASLADRIVEALQAIAAQHDIPYMKLVSQQVVAAGGFTAGDDSAVVRIAEAALAVRERCLELFDDCGRPPAFGIGIDQGIAIGGEVGREPRLFNLWGEAVRTAETMAASAAGGASIQVSEAAYDLLRHQFLFRPRGSFYLPRVGAARTFILASQL